ncbi:MAG: sugar ABC transporter ATP-binding protein [Victivallaceae bacterium]|nr:sugar ABC transporter ATP-binding protein [Victivallaceae bacterium]
MAAVPDVVALEMHGVSKSFGSTSVLDDVSFKLRRGTVHAICGENGAGKSTLMKILSGVHRADGGTMALFGSPYNPAGPLDALDSGIAMIYQELNLAEHLTVAENIFLGNELHRSFPSFQLDNHAMVEETRRLVSEYGFGIDPEVRISSLSVGEAQLVELLKAIHRNARIIVMDEPTSSLSSNETKRLFEIIFELRSRGVSVVYISHRMEEIFLLADDVSVLRDGMMVFSGPASSTSTPEVIRLMVGREMKDFYPERHVTVGSVTFEVRDLGDGDCIGPVSFSVRAGEIVGMAGLVGAGRTEIADLVFGAAPRASGELLLDGRPINIGSPAQAILHGIGYLTEDRKRTGLCVKLPCDWNITLPNLSKLSHGGVVDLAAERAAAVDFGERGGVKWPGPDAPAESLSGGNQQKLLLARWLMAQSRFLIFDEPTRGIDIGARRDVYLMLNRMAEEGRAILVISSDLPEIFGVCDRILVVRDGRIVADLETGSTSPDEVMKYAVTNTDIGRKDVK